MPKYTCSLCNFETTRKSHYTRHLESSKHKKRISTPDDNTDKDKSDDTDDFTCPGCDKSFKNRMGLWRHKKTCSDFQSLEPEPKVVQATAVESSVDKELELKKVELELEKPNFK